MIKKRIKDEALKYIPELKDVVFEEVEDIGTKTEKKSEEETGSTKT
jgi:hypothetical protein